MYIDGIQSTNVPNIWPEVKPLLEQCWSREHSVYDEKRVFNDLYYGKQQLWVGHDTTHIEIALTTKIEQEGDDKVCYLLLMGGSNFIREGKIFYPVLEAWAKEQGCSCIRAWIRIPLFEKVLKKQGFEIIDKTIWGLLVSKSLDDKAAEVNEGE